MSRNEDFDNGIWSDPEFEELSAPAAWLYIWSWTNPRCDMAGIYKVGRRAMTESRVGLEDLDYALAELSAAHFAYYEHGVLWVRSRVKRLRSKSPRMAISVARDFVKIPVSHPLHARWLAVYGGHSWLRTALADALANLKDTSHEVHEIAGVAGDHENLTETPPGVPMDGDMEGEGSSSTSSDSSRARGRVDQLTPPRELAAMPEIAARLDPVLAILAAVQAERGGSTPTVRGVGLALVAYPARDHLAVARDLQHWALAGRGQRKAVRDWVRTYRTFLDGSEDAAPTRTTAGTPTAAGRGSTPVENTGDLSRFSRLRPANAREVAA